MRLRTICTGIGFAFMGALLFDRLSALFDTDFYIYHFHVDISLFLDDVVPLFIVVDTAKKNFEQLPLADRLGYLHPNIDECGFYLLRCFVVERHFDLSYSDFIRDQWREKTTYVRVGGAELVNGFPDQCREDCAVFVRNSG